MRRGPSSKALSVGVDSTPLRLPAGGSSGAGEVPEDLERMNEMWDSIQQREVSSFF